ncbi:creatinine amidohydrolase [Lentibacillus halodurans]|uniref:Creatinine amidohydrolase n=1 Tax=Lentibacillus halodurans TaxID=237679 RepID=A0A1I0X0L9_9BACI|nr:creatininase family protein [Lentibacillus halodurans]SFA93970.1 creatinine amidohydrolase [Lentibacillus halodurans]
MSTDKHALHLMTWKEIEQSFKKDPVIIVPLGSTEEHGPHSITGDYLAAAELAKRVAEQSDAYYLPVIPFGNSEYFRGYPGTISLSQETVLRILEEIFQSLTEHGITKIVVFNGHAGNSSAVDQIARKLKRESNIMIASVDLWQWLSNENKRDIYQEEDPSGHGGEPLTSVMSYLYPQEMRMDLLDEWAVEDSWESFAIENFKKARADTATANLFFDMEEISREGIVGNPANASFQRGEKIVKTLTEYGVQLVSKIKQSNMVQKKKKSN